MRRFLLPLFLLLIAVLPQHAYGQVTSSFRPTGAASLSVSNTSSNVAFPTAGPTTLITNTGSTAAYLVFGGSAVAATTSNYLINPGCSVAYDMNGQGFVAAITAASTTTLLVMTGSGVPTLPLSACTDGSAGPPQNVNIIQTVVTPTDRGGTITLGGTAQTLAASNASRKSLVVQNPCTLTGQGSIAALEDLYVSVTGSATVAGAGNFADLPACSSVEISWNGTVITAAVSVNAATTGHRWSATESQ